MNPFNAFSLRYLNGKLELLDQRLLPDKEDWVDASEPTTVWKLIHNLSVRGAPMIGVAAAMCLADYSTKGHSKVEIIEAAQHLKTARPTAVNLEFCCDAIIKECEREPFDITNICEMARLLMSREAESCDKMAEFGASLVNDGDGILTHCNTGSLATPGCGTALGVIRRAHAQGKRIHVYVDETRPLLQGGRLTAYELERERIPYTLICDNMAAVLMRQGKIQRIFVGADRIACNGDFANKIGTFGVAVIALHHRVPMHAVAPVSTFDARCAHGDLILIEQRAGDEVRGAHGVRWAPATANTFNPAFDVTPIELVTSIIFDKGIFTREQIQTNGLVALLASSTASTN